MPIYKHKTIHQLLETQAFACGDNLALTDGEQLSQTYAHLLNTVDNLIIGLCSSGINLQDRVSIVGPNGVGLAVALLAVSSFATAVPLNPAYTATEFESYFREIRVNWLIVFD